MAPKGRTVRVALFGHPLIYVKSWVSDIVTVLDVRVWLCCRGCIQVHCTVLRMNRLHVILYSGT
jgi:hypothetical protein